MRVPTPVRDAVYLARQVAGSVSGGQTDWGIVADETGMMGPVIANRVAGVIAVACRDPLEAKWARERIGANVLCISTEIIAPGLAREILEAWISAAYKHSKNLSETIREPNHR